MALALVFPGQGAQSVGMGRDLADAYPEAREVFDEVDEALGEKLSDLVWNGDADTLTLTENAQPALMAMSLATLRALEAEGFDTDRVALAAGHSLGEYSALAAAGSLRIADAARLLRSRGRAMQESVPVGEGAMAAILGLGLAEARAVSEKAAENEVCQAANDNDPGQVVVSGHRGAVERTIALAKEAGAKRAVLLPVSAPFHCALMQPAADRMAETLEAADIARPRFPVVSNVTAEPVSEPAKIRRLLVEQITAPVRWREGVERMVADGVEEIWEIGAGKALSGMVRRIDRSVSTRSIGTANDIAAAMGKESQDV